MRPIVGPLALTLVFITVTIPVHTDARRFDLDDVSRVVRIADPQFAPDGRSIVAVVSRANMDEDRWDGELASIEVGKSIAQPHVLTSGRRGIGSPRFAPDGSKIAFLMMDGPGKDAHLQIFTIGKSGGDPKAVTSAPTGVQQFAWSPDGRTIAFASADEAQKKTGSEQFNDSFEIVNDDFTTTAAVLPTHLWVVSAGGGAAKRLTSGSWSLPTSHPPGPPAAPIAWSPDGKSIAFTEQASPHTGGGQQRSLRAIDVADGSIRPLGVRGSVPIYSPDGKTIAYTGTLMGFSPQAQLFAAHGWLVFQPNYRGSDNLGAAYQRAIRNDAGDGPGRDVWAGMDAVKKRGNVDESRVAVSGWSYGGYMTAWMLGHYQGWEAAVAGAAVTDQLDQYNLGDGNGNRGNGSPWADPRAMERMHAQSPITYVSRIKAPTLIMTDMADYRVPPMQSFKLYHALVDNGVTVKFVGYPVHGHSPTDPIRQRDVQRRWSGWLADYLDKPVNAPAEGKK